MANYTSAFDDVTEDTSPALTSAFDDTEVVKSRYASAFDDTETKRGYASAFDDEAAPVATEPEELDRVSQLLSDNPEAMQKYTSAKRGYADAVGYDEFSQEMESMMQDSGEAPPPDVSIKELADSPRFIRLASKYMTKRLGKDVGDVRNYESTEDFVKRYMEHTRALSSNMGDVASELSAITAMSPEEKKDLAKLYQLTPHIAVAGSKGGDTIMNAIADYAYYGITDPSNVITLGSGMLIKSLSGKVVSNKVLLEAVKSQWAPIVGTAGVDGALGYMENADRQSIDLELGLREERSISESVASGGLNALFGAGFSALGVGWASKSKSPAEKLNEKLGITGKDAATKDPAEAMANRQKLIEEYDPIMGIVAREDLEAANVGGVRPLQDRSIVDPQVRTSVQQDITLVVGDWAKRNPEVAKELGKAMEDENMLISDVVYTLLKRERAEGDTVIYDDLSNALTSAGVTPEQFAAATRSSVSEAGRTLQTYKVLKQTINKLRDQDPGAADLLLRMQQYEDVGGPFTKLYNFMRVADAETRAIMVSGVGTTVRNAFGGAAYITLGTFNNAVESTLYHGGKAITAVVNGTASKEGFKDGMANLYRDSLSFITRLAKQGESDEMVKRLLADNSDLNNRLFHTMQTVDDKITLGKGGTHELSTLAKTMNTLNRVQDGVFRRAIFTSRVDHYLRREGLGTVEEYLAKNKPVPAAILKKATDDSLYGTFAYMPKNRGMGMDKSLKHNVESMANHAVKIVEGLPFVPVIGTADQPFIRFMFNAMSYQYKYSPLQIPTVVGDAAQLLYKKGTKGEIDPAELANFRNKASTAAVGSAAFYAALRYRMENEDVEWYEVKDEQNRPVDVRSMFPASPYLAMAELYLSMTQEGRKNMDIATAIEGFTGSQIKTGQLYGMDMLKELTSGSLKGEEGVTVTKEKFAEMAGKWLGLQAGRVLTPTQLISDMVAATNLDERIVRDKNQIDGVGWERLTDAAMKALMYKTPILQQELPPLQSPSREGDIIRQDTSVRQFYGARVQSERTPIETELMKRGIELYTLVPQTQDGHARAIFAELTPVLLEAMVGATLQSDMYQKLTPAMQTEMLKKRVSEVKTQVSKLGTMVSTSNSYRDEGVEDFVARGMWMSLSGTRRKMVNEMRKKYGQESIEDSRDFRIGLEIARGLYKAL